MRKIEVKTKRPRLSVLVARMRTALRAGQGTAFGSQHADGSSRDQVRLKPTLHLRGPRRRLEAAAAPSRTRFITSDTARGSRLIFG